MPEMSPKVLPTQAVDMCDVYNTNRDANMEMTNNIVKKKKNQH